MSWRRRSASLAIYGLLVAAVLVLSACGPTARPTGPGEPRSGSSSPPQASAPRGTLTVAWAQEPSNLRPKFGEQGFVGADLGNIFDSALAYYDNRGTLHPLMAQQLPTPENGGWVINPDGTMVTIFRLRENIRWHDGVPLTAHDFAFAHRVDTDPGVPFSRTIEGLISEVEARDNNTIVIRWSESYIRANEGLRPLPRHLLEEKYRTARGDEFVSGEEWTTGFVGSGPYRLERWDRGSRIVARAYQDWFRGPPRIETIEIRFITDPNTVLAHMLSGEVDLAWTPLVRFDIATAQELWAARGEGYLKSWETRLRYLEFQYREVPNWQRAGADPRIRQALIHAIDRPAIAEVMTGGLGRAADAWVLPVDPIFPDVDRAITKYPYDPRRASSLLAEAGWQAQLGSGVTDPDGKTLDIEMNGGSTGPQIATIIADNWKAVGVNSSVATTPAANARDPVFRATFPGTHIGETNATPFGFRFISAMIPNPPLTLGWNVGSFSDPEVDRLHNLAVTSFDERVRRDAYVGLNQRMSAQAAYSPIYYPAEIVLARSRLTGPVGEYGWGLSWNIFEWEVAD